MFKKFVSIILSTLLTGGLLVGCGAKEETTPAEATVETEETTALPSGDVSLRVWGADEDEALINEIISSFIAEYGSQANLTITFEAHSESSCKDDILGDVLNAPDVFTFADDQLMAFVASGVLKKVPNDGEISGRNLAASNEAASVNGTLYAYPLTADNGYFLYYNKAVLSDEDVASMDSLLAAASANGQKVFMEMNSGWYMYSFFGNTDMEIGLNDDGISTYCNWNAKNTNITGVDVAEAMAKIGANPAFTSESNDGFVSGAADGTFVAGISGIWDENGIKEAWGDDYAACKLPTYTVKGEQLQMASYAGYKLVGANAYSKNAAWANKFADWMTNEQNQTLRFEKRGRGPSNTNASGAGAVAQSKAIQALQQQAEYSSLQRVGGTYWDPASKFGSIMSQGNPSGLDLQTLLNEMVTEITGEESTGDVEEATEEVVDETAEETSEETTEEESEEVEETEDTEDSSDEQQ
jgi:arabinogalactan oligomer/maltooligosaccharide transport system substrate-binding protein